MKARVFGTEFVVDWRQFITVSAIFLIFGLFFVVLSLALNYLALGHFPEIWDNFITTQVIEVGGVISAPVLAWLFLAFAPKGKNDEKVCRSMAAAFFLFGAALQIVIVFYFFSLTAYYEISLNPAGMSINFVGEELFNLLSGIAGYVFSSLLIYLWMLFLLDHDKRRAYSSAIYGAGIAVALLTLKYLAVFFISYHEGQIYTPMILFDDVILFVGTVLSGFILLYHTGGKELDRKAPIFIGAYLADPIFKILSVAVSIYPITNAIDPAARLIGRIVFVSLLYIAAKNWKDQL